MKKIIIWIAIIIWLIILAWMYKFNYLSNLEGYDVDWNKIEKNNEENQKNNAKYITTIEDNNIPVDPAIIDKMAKKYPKIEWIDCIWNINQKDIACVLIDQINFSWLSEIIIFRVNNNLDIVGEKIFEQKSWESVNFVCGDSCYPSDFWFEWDGILKYKWHELISPGEIYTIEY